MSGREHDILDDLIVLLDQVENAGERASSKWLRNIGETRRAGMYVERALLLVAVKLDGVEHALTGIQAALDRLPVGSR